MATPTPRTHPDPGTAPTTESGVQADLLELTLHRPGTRRTVDPSRLFPGPVDPSVTTSVKLFDSPTYRELAGVDRRIRSYLRRTALPLDLPLKTGTYLVPSRLRGTIEGNLRTLLAERADLQEKFLSSYPTLKKRAVPGVPFPTEAELESAFQADVRFTPWSDFVARLWAEAGREARQVLRRQFLEVMESFARSLEWTDDEKKRPLHASTVEHACHFLATYDDRSIVDDPELTERVRRARKLFRCDRMEEFTREMRKNDDRRRAVGEEASDLVEDTRRILVGKPPAEPDGRVH